MTTFSDEQTAEIREMMKPFADNVCPPDGEHANLLKMDKDWPTMNCVPVPCTDQPFVAVNLETFRVGACTDPAKKHAIQPLGMKTYFYTNSWIILPVLRSVITVPVDCPPGAGFDEVLAALRPALMKVSDLYKETLTRLLEHDVAVLMPTEAMWWPETESESKPHLIGATFTCAAARVRPPALMKVPLFQAHVARPCNGSFGQLLLTRFLDFNHYM